MLPGLICTHIAEAGAAPAYLFHAVPQGEDDLTHTLLCALSHEPAKDMRVVDLERYLTSDPELRRLGEELPEGYRASRTAPGQPWVVEALPSWELLDVEELNREYPTTFNILPREQRESLTVGDVVKLIFELCRRPAPGEPGAERMWVKIIEVREGPEYVGTLDNVPTVIQDLKADDVITFGPANVADVAPSSNKEAA